MTDSFEDRTSLPEPGGDGALLTAYLFGELPQNVASQLEQRLATEPELQDQFQALQDTLHVLKQAEQLQAPVELGDDARSALRMAAAQRADDTATNSPSGPQPSKAAGGVLLAFPWLRAAAAVLIVAGGYSVYQVGNGGDFAPSSGHLDSAAEASAPAVEEEERKSVGLRSSLGARLGRLGYADSEAPMADESMLQALGYVSGDKGLAPGSSSSSLDLEAVSGGESLGQKSLRERSRGFLTEQVSVGGRPAPESERSGESASPGGLYKGPGDSVPPSTPAAPAADSANVARVLAEPQSVLPIEGVVGAVQADPSLGAFFGLEVDEFKVDARFAETRSELERGALALQSEAGWLGDVDSYGQNFGEMFERLGYADELQFDLPEGGVTAGLRSQTAVTDEAWSLLREAQAEQLILHIRPISEEEDPSDMFFRYYGDNAFVDSGRDNFSTFSVDVDSASYPLARNYIASGQLPPRAAVRTEEMVNYFSHELPAPQEEMFSVAFYCAPTPFAAADNNVLLEIGVKAREVDTQERMPMNLVFVVDKSGSMREGGRMDLVKRSLELVLDQMRDDDRVGIVSFDREGHIVQESVEARERWRVRESLRGLQPGGATNAGEGLFLGYEMLDRNFIEGGINRVVLASDGVANTGETDQSLILQQVEDFTTRSVDLTTIGVGMGNHNDVFLEQLANQGNGSCHYIDSMEESRRVFLDEFSSTMQTVARDVKIQVEFDSNHVKRWRQIGYENRALTQEQFRDDSVDAGEVGAGHEIVALYELELSEAVDLDADDAGQLATVNMRWKPDLGLTAWMSNNQTVVTPGFSAKTGQPAVERSWQFSRDSIVQTWNEAPARFRLSAVAAQFAEYLRRSYHVRGDDYALLEANADALARELDSDASVRELRDLVRSTRSLVQRSGPQDELWQLIEEGRRLALLQQELRQDSSGDDQTRELMVELIERNTELEQRIRDYLEQRD